MHKTFQQPDRFVDALFESRSRLVVAYKNKSKYDRTYMMQLIETLHKITECSIEYKKKTLYSEIAPYMEAKSNFFQKLGAHVLSSESASGNADLRVVKAFLDMGAVAPHALQEINNKLGEVQVINHNQFLTPMKVEATDASTSASTEILPQDFRKIGIYPNASDISGDDVSLVRKNIVDGKYESIDHYLDIQFRLLREDFVRPLRNAINQFRNIKDAMGTSSNIHIDEAYIYANVEIFEERLFESGGMHRCKFDCQQLANVEWRYNKRMMPGSLVCFSSDDFQTFFFATVTGYRNPMALSNGNFNIQFEYTRSSMPAIGSPIKYMVIEPKVYFEVRRRMLDMYTSN